MSIDKIISIAGKSGLYKVIGQTKNSVIVESIEDGKRFPAYSTDKVSALSDISIFTEDEDIPLADIFDKMYKAEDGKISISHSAKPDELKVKFESFVTDYDKDRVYVSDIKKVFRWYNELVTKGFLKPEPKEESKKEEKSKAVKKTTAKKKNTTPKKTKIAAAKPAVKKVTKKPATAKK